MIQVKKLEKSYDNVNHLHILQNLNLTVEDGEFLGIMGASGSGKSTFLRILGGLETFSGGEAEVCGENLRTMKDAEKELYRQKVVSYVFQDYNLLSGLTVKENIILPCTMMHAEEKATEQDYTAITRKLGIDAYEERFPDEISGGEQQRAAIARAVLKHSKVLLADEPTGSIRLVQHYPKVIPVIFPSLSILISSMTDRQRVRFSSRVKVLYIDLKSADKMLFKVVKSGGVSCAASGSFSSAVVYIS